MAVIAGIVALGGALLLFGWDPPATHPAPNAPVTPAPITPVAAVATTAALPPPASTVRDHPDWIAYPDGSAYPPLNGVTKAPDVAWHRLLPFTPVVRTERDALGRDWYVHANGARSTTYFDGNGTAIGDVRMVQPTQPMLDDTAADKK